MAGEKKVRRWFAQPPWRSRLWSLGLRDFVKGLHGFFCIEVIDLFCIAVQAIHRDADGGSRFGGAAVAAAAATDDALLTITRNMA